MKGRRKLSAAIKEAKRLGGQVWKETGEDASPIFWIEDGPTPETEAWFMECIWADEQG